jgi:hypothetical protein
MDDQELREIRQSVDTLIKRSRRLTAALMIAIVAMAAAVAALAMAGRTTKAAGPVGGVLTLRGLIIVDGRGIERVRIQAPLPDPLVLGKRFPRGGAVSGILLSDEEGNERSGYVTSDGYPNVFFTLDSLARQHVLFITEPQGDPTLRLWDGANAATLSAGQDGPGLKLTAGEKVVAELPGRGPAAK